MELNLRDEITQKADRLAIIKQAIKGLNNEKDELEGYFLKLADEGLKNTKLKTVEYYGTGNNKIIATMAQNLNVIYPSFLKKVFGEAYGDVITEETKYKVNAAATRMLNGIWLKNFTKTSIAEIVNQMPVDDKTKQALLKKLKGAKFESDKKNLIAIAGFEEKDAEEYAYFISEAAVWENFRRLMKARGLTEENEAEFIDWIDGAVVVEETPKITVEM